MIPVTSIIDVNNISAKIFGEDSSWHQITISNKLALYNTRHLIFESGELISNDIVILGKSYLCNITFTSGMIGK